MMKKVAIFGSTGSIGTQAIDVIEQHSESFMVTTLVGGKNITLLAQQAKKLQPQLVVCAQMDDYSTLKDSLKDYPHITVAAGRDAVINAAKENVDIHLAAITGIAGLAPVFEAAKQGCIIALANKEALVCAGALLLEEVRKSGGRILPVDSEHSAIFQCLEQENRKAINHIVLTASGGPFREKSLDALAHVTPEQAVAHPNWSMGKKISVDSATMVNKALELIEACWLFDVPESMINVVIHPNSIMHSAVMYQDGSMVAHLGMPDMRTPIAYALCYPQRVSTNVQILDLPTLGKMEFFALDNTRFPAVSLARETMRQGGSSSILFNAVNEVMVDYFLQNRISFTQITANIEHAMQTIASCNIQNIDDVMKYDQMIRHKLQSEVI